MSRLRRERSPGLAVSGVAEGKEAGEVKGEAGEQAVNLHIFINLHVV